MKIRNILLLLIIILSCGYSKEDIKKLLISNNSEDNLKAIKFIEENGFKENFNILLIGLSLTNETTKNKIINMFIAQERNTLELMINYFGDTEIRKIEFQNPQLLSAIVYEIICKNPSLVEQYLEKPSKVIRLGIIKYLSDQQDTKNIPIFEKCRYEKDAVIQSVAIPAIALTNTEEAWKKFHMEWKFVIRENIKPIGIFVGEQALVNPDFVIFMYNLQTDDPMRYNILNGIAHCISHNHKDEPSSKENNTCNYNNFYREIKLGKEETSENRAKLKSFLLDKLSTLKPSFYHIIVFALNMFADEKDVIDKVLSLIKNNSSDESLINNISVFFNYITKADEATINNMIKLLDHKNPLIRSGSVNVMINNKVLNVLPKILESIRYDLEKEPRNMYLSYIETFLPKEALPVLKSIILNESGLEPAEFMRDCFLVVTKIDIEYAKQLAEEYKQNSNPDPFVLQSIPAILEAFKKKD